MHIEIPGLFALDVPWWMLALFVLVLLPSLLRRIGSGKKTSVSDTTDPVLQGGKSVNMVPYQQTKKISSLAKRAKGNLVVVVDVSGPILDTAKSVSSFSRKGATFGRDLGAALEQVSKLPEVKAVLIRMSTPGGTVTGSDGLARGIDRCKAMGKRVVVYVPDLSASGGVWSMVSADYIIADKHALIGSVGVRGPQIMTYDAVTRVGTVFGGVTAQRISATTLHSGKGKNFGDPFAPVDEDEMAHFQDLMDESYDLFLQRVSSCRPKLTREKLRDLGARLFHAETALVWGFIDGVGSIADAKDRVAKSINVPWDECGLVYLQPAAPKGLGLLLAETLASALQVYSGTRSIQVSDVLSQQTVQVLYVPPSVSS